MVNRSPSSNFVFRNIRNMAPTQTGNKNAKGKLTSKVPAGSAIPVVKKKKVHCSKCKGPHFLPTGRACQKLATSPTPDMSSTLVDTEEVPPTLSPTLSPVRPNPATMDALAAQAQFLAQLQAVAQAPPIASHTMAAQPQQAAPILINRPGPRTMSAPTAPDG